LDVHYYRMRAGQEVLVSNLIHGLIADYGRPFSTKLNPETILTNSGFLNIEVAEIDGKIIGICAWVMTFSTWRGVRGMYIADHFVVPNAPQKDVARQLLLLAAISAAAEGAAFIRTEVDITNESNQELYAEAGFWTQTRHVVHFLEPELFEEFIGEALPE
jgi:GNAT superfamily N-acetyltransferase